MQRSSILPRNSAAVLIIILTATFAAAHDWPAYRHDNYRSGKTPEKLDAVKLAPAWKYISPAPPQPAWAGPAKWDAYRNLKGLKSMRNYDPVFHPVVANRSLFFASSIDDAVHCLDAKTGKERWVFFTDAPVRIAPAIVDGRVYFGSDDGAAYCLEVNTGALIWQHQPAPRGRMILNNGRFISRAPIRTGVLVDNGVAYFAAGLLPWQPTYLCAVSAKTGKVEGKGNYVQKMTNATIEGPLLCSLTRLITPQGRVAPLLFERETGKRAGQLSGGGGVFVMVTNDDQILHGPGNKTGWITNSNVKTGAKLASFPGAAAMVIHGSIAYILTDRSLSAVDRAARKTLWTKFCDFPHELILAHDVLFAGGTDVVAAFDAKTGNQLAKLQVRGRAFGLAAADGALYVSTDEGEITCFRESNTTPQPVKLNGGDARPLLPLRKVDLIKEPGLIGRWVFQRDLLDNGRIRDLNGKQPAALLGGPDFGRLGEIDTLRLEGLRTHLQLAANHSQSTIPKKEITATAWVRIDRPQTWGGIIGAIQDNGSYERGWLLGYNGLHFCMAVNAKSGPNRLTYLKAKTPFQPGRWYHVAGVYDGQVLKIYVNGKLENSSNEQKGDIFYPPSAPFVMGAYKDQNEFHPIAGSLHEVRLYARALAPKQIQEQFQQKQKHFPQSKPAPAAAQIALGPYLQLTGPSTAVVRWKTHEDSPTTLELRHGDKTMRRHHSAAKTRDHKVELKDLRHKTLYHYAIQFNKDGETKQSQAFECDTFFNYSLRPIRQTPTAIANSELYKRISQRVLLAAGNPRGMCVLIGADDGGLALEMARASQMRVVGVGAERRRVNAVRQILSKAGCYGTRIAYHHVADTKAMPFTGEFANLVVVDARNNAALPAILRDEIKRITAPGGRIVILDREHKLTALQQPSSKSAGVWTHLYGLPDNSAFAGESLGGAKGIDDLDVQWIGRPGPRANPDRNGRKPSPLAVNGRLFVQGLQRLIAMDAYNGSILWSLEIPPLARFNMPRDCSNWCADDNFVYAAIADQTWKIDAATGKVVDFIGVVPGPNSDWQWDWGYVARSGNNLIGSAVKKGTSHTNFFGGSGAGWYDARGGEVTHQICSDNLFAKDYKTGSQKWVYESLSVLLNSTITIGKGRIYFVECRHPKVKKGETRRVGAPELWQMQYLIALDEATGKKTWERKIDTVDGAVVFYLAYKDEKLVLVSSQKKYHVYAFDAMRGTPLWDTGFNWQNGDHGGHMSRPALVDGKVYVRPRVLDATTGKLLPETMPRGGCGTYACTKDAVIFRAGNITMWDREKHKVTRWNRLRPDCWLSTIPAQGMLLAPEGGGGCSCGSWLETSIGFRPVSNRGGK